MKQLTKAVDLAMFFRDASSPSSGRVTDATKLSDHHYAHRQKDTKKVGTPR